MSRPSHRFRVAAALSHRFHLPLLSIKVNADLWQNPRSEQEAAIKQGARMPLQKWKPKRLYLIFDDWAWGYSIRALKLLPRSRHHRVLRHPVPVRHPLPGRLPPPSLRLEAPRGSAWNFTAVGTRIVATHTRNQRTVPGGFLPIVDVSSRGITFGPGQVFPHMPIYISVGNELFALSSNSFNMLSMEKLWPPPLEVQCTGDDSEWSWCSLPQPPFHRMDVISHALHSDGRTILASTDEATFAFDTKARVWERRGEWKLPFTGRAHFVPALDAFVGIAQDSPHLVFRSCKVVSDGPVWKLGEELLEVGLLDEGPCEFHHVIIGATLVYLGGETGTEFCLVQCVGPGDYFNDDTWEEEDARMEGVGSFERVKHNGCVYRLITFSVAYDDNGALTTGNTCLVKSYDVPEETTDAFVAAGNPVAFWL